MSLWCCVGQGSFHFRACSFVHLVVCHLSGTRPCEVLREPVDLRSVEIQTLSVHRRRLPQRLKFYYPLGPKLNKGSELILSYLFLPM